MHLYYNDAGQSYIVSLPVKQTLIPDAVVSKANETWGPAVYDIAQIRGLNGQPVYHVRIIENGQVASQYMAEDGSKVIDVFRVETSDPMDNMPASGTSQQMDTQSQMNLNTSGNKEIKIKTETSDGKEIKTKIKNGKVKTKVDD
jgi:hypothetical protein